MSRPDFRRPLAIASLLGLSLLGACSLFESEPEGPALPPDMAAIDPDGKLKPQWLELIQRCD